MIIMAGTLTEGVCGEEDLGGEGVMAAPVAGVGVDFRMVTMKGEVVAGVLAVVEHEEVVVVVGQEPQEAVGLIG